LPPETQEKAIAAGNLDKLNLMPQSQLGTKHLVIHGATFADGKQGYRQGSINLFNIKRTQGFYGNLGNIRQEKRPAGS